MNKEFMIRKAARKYLRFCQLPFEDIMQEGHLALCLAERSFDPAREVHFFWYAKRVLRNHFLALRAKMSHTLPLSHNIELEELLIEDRRRHCLLCDQYDLPRAVAAAKLTELESRFWNTFVRFEGDRGGLIETARTLGISKQRAHQIYRRTIRKLRRQCEKQKKKNLTLVTA
ncbi:MAG: sigma-70 family RNA polymerase sigma factor [Planctomycetes bacterium]|nr:sigma-70 family RNA polymerase sigma factor [Planctomycetota bacterium]